VPQHNSTGDATSTTEDNATVGIMAISSFTHVTFYILISQSIVRRARQKILQWTTDYFFFFLKRIHRTPKGRFFRGECDITSGVQLGALLCSRIGNPCLLCMLQICRNKDKEWLLPESSSMLLTPQNKTGALSRLGLFLNLLTGHFNWKNMGKKPKSYQCTPGSFK
jgi:hypothetical protein